MALVTGGDSGIGRSVAVHFVREGAKVAIVYLEEDEDADKTMEMVKQEGGKRLVIRGDIPDREFCRQCVEQVIDNFGTLNILANNSINVFFTLLCTLSSCLRTELLFRKFKINYQKNRYKQAMKTIEIKQKLHHYIETVPDKKLKAIYTMVEDDIKEPYNFWDDEDFVAELKRREKAYSDGSVSGYSMEESITRARRAVSEVK